MLFSQQKFYLRVHQHTHAKRYCKILAKLGITGKTADVFTTKYYITVSIYKHNFILIGVLLAQLESQQDSSATRLR